MLLVTAQYRASLQILKTSILSRRQDERRRGRPGGAAADNDPKETSAEMKRGNKEEGKQVNEVFTTKYQNRHVSLIGRRPTDHCTWVKHMSLRRSPQA